MPRLSKYFATKAVEQLALSDSIREHTLRLIDALDANDQANVSNLHARLFPLNTQKSANSSLNRLLSNVNSAAEALGLPFRAEITADKKLGAAGRYVWFEGNITPPTQPYTSELNAIPKQQLVEGQRGLILNDLPVVVLITFNTHETQAVLGTFCPDGKPLTETREGMTYNILGVHGGMQVVHRVSSQGEGEAQNATHDAIRAWQPRAILGVGIAFGMNSNKQRIGDVLISESVRDYELGRISQDGSITPRGNKPPASPVLLQRFRHFEQSCANTRSACLTWPTMRFGPILSGNKLVDNLNYRNSLQTIENEAVGGEMEAVGIQLASDRFKVDWIIVKAICDWGDGNKNAKSKENDQQLAAQHAAKVVKAALDLGSLYIDPPPPGGKQKSDGKRQPPTPPTCCPPATSRMNLRDSDNIPDRHWVLDTLGRPTQLRKDMTIPTPDVSLTQAIEGVDVLQYLLDWCSDRDGAPLFALLGEYGMGKTITCQRLSRELESRRANDATQPLPLYFDLRHLTGLDKRVPTLRETLEECMQRGWIDSGNPHDYNYDNILHWIAQGAVIIVDGLDEALVKLKESDGQTFTNNILRLHADAEARGAPAHRIKLLISCRTQYFRTLRDQKTHFTSQERGEHGPDRWRALVLLPLSEEQVRRYLANALPGSDPNRVMETIRAVHNLEELTQRPYTLKLVGEFIPEIEQQRMAGATVYGVTLYRSMARRWLERDNGKHHIRPEHKMKLAAHLSAYLWQQGAGTLPAGEIETWFHAWLDSQADLHRRYVTLHPDQLEEDLRTATFLTREDQQAGSSFKFAHTSLLEFFLADYLFQAIADNMPERWAIKRPSNETLDFLGQMLAEANDPQLLQTLQQWRLSYRPQASELLLAYTLTARTGGWPVPVLTGIALTNAKLRSWTIRGKPSGAKAGILPLDLSGADFRGADLREVVFDGVKLSHANFQNARLTQANFLDLTADNSNWTNAECTASIWHSCTLSMGEWHHANGHRPQFLNSVTPPNAAELTDCSSPIFCPPTLPSAQLSSETRLRWLIGHTWLVTACAFSPDGGYFLSAGDDGSLQLRNAASGESLLTCTGHQGRINACAFSPDGTRLLSAGNDGILRLWGTASGESLLTCTGHEGGINACAFSPDGTRLLSAGNDRTLYLWDAASGEPLLTCTGHQGGINACAFSPDGTRFLSAGNDGTLRLWNAASGQSLLTCTGHQDRINACAFSPDGTRVLSAGNDGTLRLWNAASGEPLLTCTGHQDWIYDCAFSPDGTRLLSAGFDGTLRLWDAVCGTLLRVHAQETSIGGRKGVAIWDTQTQEILYADGDAWRWLAWVSPGQDGRPERLPMEVFGQVPKPKHAMH